MQKAEQILQAMHKLGQQKQPLTRIYRCLYSEEMYLNAYNKLYRNSGATTPGVDDADTVDGMSIDRIHRIIDQIRHERFKFKPSRRTYINKKNGKKRPLGMPTFTDKLVQEVIRMILETYYEPRFSETSHGFRPGRGCHTALTEIKKRFHGTTWFIEGDIRGCFDNIDHSILLNILRRDIQDRRFLNLIEQCLKAGYFEDWKYHKTYSGAPQGGVLSPLLSNIYLHELDTFVNEILMPQYNRGKRRGGNNDYQRCQHAIRRARAEGDEERVKELQQQRRQIPSQNMYDPNYRRLRYVRYADDFILGFIGSKSEADAIKHAIGTFLQDNLKLEMSEEKTLITHARTEHARFLGYAVSIEHANDKLARRSNDNKKMRSVNGNVRLGIPYGLIHELSQRYKRGNTVMSEVGLLMCSDAHIILEFQQRFRGIAEYYKYAADRYQLNKLKYVMQQALTKTLAHKFKISVPKVYKRYRGTQVVQGFEYKTLQVGVPTRNGTKTIYWGAIPLRTVKSTTESIRDTRYFEQWNNIRADLITRLRADQCELCGKETKCEVHHVRKLANLQKRWQGRKTKPEWVFRMIALRRKTLVVCPKCHSDIHAGRPTPKQRA